MSEKRRQLELFRDYLKTQTVKDRTVEFWLLDLARTELQYNDGGKVAKVILSLFKCSAHKSHGIHICMKRLGRMLEGSEPAKGLWERYMASCAVHSATMESKESNMPRAWNRAQLLSDIADAASQEARPENELR